MIEDEELKYPDILKVEFMDMIERFLEPRAGFHVYTIGRMCTHGTMLGFDYGYQLSEVENCIIKFIDLKQYGTIYFSINYTTNNGCIITPNSDEIISNFLKYFSAESTISL